jgi:hypothetical protein
LLIIEIGIFNRETTGFMRLHVSRRFTAGIIQAGQILLKPILVHQLRAVVRGN